MFKTLDGMRAYCAAHDVPLEQLKFALGENKGALPSWHYIYQDTTGQWVVGKNSHAGKRFERYRGYSEADAVTLINEMLCEATSSAAGKSSTEMLTLLAVVIGTIIYLIILLL